MPDLPIDSVVTAARRRWPDTDEAWVDNLRRDLAEVCRRHDANVDRILKARYALVLSATSPRGPLVVRMSTDRAATHHGYAAQALARAQIGPQVHELGKAPSGVWLVTDRVIPGIPLTELRPAPWVTEAFVTVLTPMLGRPIDGAEPLPRLDDWLRARLLDDDLSDAAPGQSVAPRPARLKALDTLDGLRTYFEPSLCHGDASPLNILLSGSNSFRLIDPRGVAGEVAYDVAVIALKAADHDASTDLSRALASRLGLDQSRVEAWREVAAAARI